jgi:hypothetical protein
MVRRLYLIVAVGLVFSSSSACQSNPRVITVEAPRWRESPPKPTSEIHGPAYRENRWEPSPTVTINPYQQPTSEIERRFKEREEKAERERLDGKSEGNADCNCRVKPFKALRRGFGL